MMVEAMMMAEGLQTEAVLSLPQPLSQREGSMAHGGRRSDWGRGGLQAGVIYRARKELEGTVVNTGAKMSPNNRWALAS